MQYTSYEEYLKDLALADESIVVVTAENRALIRNLPAVLGPRFIDTGITEQSMIGTSAGLALRGRKPIVHALASFLTMRAFEFIRTDVGISGLPVKLTSFVPGFLSDGNGPTHQAIEDISLMRGIPGMQVYAPADNEDMILMLESIWKNNSPVYLRANTRAAVYKHAPFEIGKAEVISEGADVEKYILKTASSSKLLVSIEDHFLTGGLYSIIAEIFLKNKITADVLPIALKTWYKPGLLSEVLEYEGFTGEKMAARILDHLKIKHELAKTKSKVVENTFDE
jgi:transketolase